MTHKNIKNYLKHDPWKVIEDSFHKEHNKNTESICSLGNGKFGQRGTLEELNTGESMLGNYVAGVYYPDKTIVGWWKIGYPDYYSKVLNAVDWSSLHMYIDGVEFDINKAEIHEWHRELDMREGVLLRTCKVSFNGHTFAIESERFCSVADDKLAVQSYAVGDFDRAVNLRFVTPLDFDVQNEDSNYDEKFWKQKEVSYDSEIAINSATTLKTNFHVASAMNCQYFIDGYPTSYDEKVIKADKYIALESSFDLAKGSQIEMNRIVTIISSLDYEADSIEMDCKFALFRYLDMPFDTMRKLHAEAWSKKWEMADIEIEGDVSAQQAIRFNIFHLNQTYTGEDSRLNIGPKGFTGEKYGGSTYWDTEAYCLPFYLSTTEEKVGKQLLKYRYDQLGKAYENAAKIGFKNGEALYPMVTMNGEESHNEWEITFEEFHRNGAIAYAIYNYENYTGDTEYTVNFGLEVLIGIARFWASRVHYSEYSGKYMMHGVTGPNEYENNVNNNWYTNYLACWCLRYTMEKMAYAKRNYTSKYSELVTKLRFEEAEIEKWKEIDSKMYYPENKELGIVLQQDNYLDKEQVLVRDVDKEHLPLNQNWSWDRILRSCFIKQADVLQGFYFFEDDFTEDEHRRNFDFYEPRTVHESSLSPCVHSILAAKLGKKEKAYEMYLRTARLDLDDYNNDTEDGLHITSMAGTWMSIVEGFAGMRVKDGKLHFTSFLPPDWTSFSFKVNFRNNLLKVRCDQTDIYIELQRGEALEVFANGKDFMLEPTNSVV